jgi:two-component system, NarL family, sensor histidine kinase UhpB
MQKRYRLYSLLLLLVHLLLFNYPLVAQPLYSRFDSLAFEKKLTQISELEDKQDYTNALAAANDALAFCKQRNFLYGEVWSLIKINDINIGREYYSDVSAPPSFIIQIGNELGNKKISGIGYMQAAQYKMYNNKPAEAEVFFQKAVQLLPDETEYTALCWNERGFNAGLQSDLQKQTEYYLNALRLYEKLNNPSGAAMVYSNLSVLYNDLGQTETAISYAKKAIAIREELKDIRGLSYSYCNISQMYLNNNLNEAAKYAALCTKAAEELKDDGRMIHAINTSGMVKERQGGKKEEGLKSALAVLEILEKKYNPSVDLSRQYLSIGIIMSESRMDSAAALHYFNKGLDMALALGDKITIRDAYISKTIFYKIRSDFYNAYENIKKYHSYKDSIITGNTQTNIAELQTKYETEKKDNEITRLYNEQKIKQLQIDKLNTEQRIKQLAIEKQNAIITGNKLLAKQKEDEINLLSKERELLDLEVKQQTAALDKQVLLAQTQRQQLELAEKEKQLNNAAIKWQKQLRNITIAAALLSLLMAVVLFNRYQLRKKLQEQETLLAVRDNIAKDLHDEVGSTLSSIKILSELSHKNIEKDKEKSAGLLKKVVEQSEQMQQSMSDIVWAVKPDNDKLENISTRMREYISQTLESKNIQTDFNASYDLLTKHIGMQQRRDLLLIFKEAVNNIAKYAQATNVTVIIKKAADHLQLLIKDNGIGFNPDIITSSSGLKNMKARARAIGGTCRIQSTPGNGTSIEIEIPLT